MTREEATPLLGMSAANEAFDSFNEDITNIVTALSRKLNAIEDLNRTRGGQASKEMIDQADADVRDAQFLVSNFDNEMRQAPFNVRQRAQQQSAPVRRQLEELTQRLRYLKDTRNSVAAVSQDSWKSQRQRLLGNQDTVKQTDDSLDRTLSVIAEAHEVGTSTASHLAENREQLLRSVGRMFSSLPISSHPAERCNRRD